METKKVQIMVKGYTTFDVNNKPVKYPDVFDVDVDDIATLKSPFVMLVEDKPILSTKELLDQKLKQLDTLELEILELQEKLKEEKATNIEEFNS